jgi:hypothetical protein
VCADTTPIFATLQISNLQVLEACNVFKTTPEELFCSKPCKHACDFCKSEKWEHIRVNFLYGWNRNKCDCIDCFRYNQLKPYYDSRINFKQVNASLQMNMQDNNGNLGGVTSSPNTGTDVVGHSGDIASAYVTDDTSTTVAETTVFKDSKASEPVVAEIPISQTENLDFTHSIVQILGRPTLIDDFNLNAIGQDMITFDNSRLPLRSYRLPWNILRKGAKVLKVANFEFIKCNMVIKIMTNASPFVAGRFWCCYSPYEERKMSPHRCINKTRAAVTSYPGAELDLQTNNSITIRIPWCDIRDAGSLSQDLLDETQLHIFYLTQILVDGTLNLNFQIFGWLEDVELRGPTSAGTLIAPTESLRSVYANLQVGKEAKGPISEVASGVSSIATALSGVPFLADVAIPVAWASSAVASVASMFGFSKPIEGSGPMVVANIPARSYGHVKGTDDSVVLGLSNENAISETEMNFMTEQDEMSVEYISNRPGLVAINTWLDNALPNAVIAYVPVGPQIFRNRTTEASPLDGTLLDLTNFEYLSGEFAYWRADICLRISVVKTPFHTGRIEVAFVPGITIPDETTDLTNCYRQILDLANDTEMLVTIPYLSPYPMLQHSYIDTDATVPAPYYASRVGTIVVRALGPLVHPPTVSPSVKVLVWKWATNVAFACPADSRLLDYTEPFTGVNTIDAELQGVGNISEPTTLMVYTRMNEPTKNLEVAQAVNGELLVSARALTRAFRRKLTAVDITSPIRTTVSDLTGGYVTRISNMFCFWRGGLAYKFYSPNLDEVDGYQIRSEILGSFPTTTVRNINPVTHTTFSSLNPFHEVNIPFYSTTRRAITNDGQAEGAAPASKFRPSVLLTTNHANLDVLVAGKDDLNMGFLYGCCPQRYPEFY